MEEFHFVNIKTEVKTDEDYSANEDVCVPLEDKLAVEGSKEGGGDDEQSVDPVTIEPEVNIEVVFIKQELKDAVEENGECSSYQNIHGSTEENEELMIMKDEGVEKSESKKPSTPVEDSEEPVVLIVRRGGKIHRVKRYPCSICKKWFTGKGNLNVHLVNVHQGTKYTCTLCEKAFSSKSNLNVHVATAHEGVKHTCTVCNKSFSEKKSLKIHFASIHEGIREYSCTLCDKDFSGRGNLNVHMLNVHEGIKHECTVCNKQFSSKSSLNGHMSYIHEGVKHTCDVCGKTFTVKSSLNIHMGTVHEGIRFVCEVCHKTFGQKRSLTRHLKRIHQLSSNGDIEIMYD